MGTVSLQVRIIECNTVLEGWTAKELISPLHYELDVFARFRIRRFDQR